MALNTTSNRGYQLPDAPNLLNVDVHRLIAALAAIDVDVAALLVAVAERAMEDHTHSIGDVTGLTGALDSKQNASEKGAANGLATLGADGKVPTAQLPAAVLGAMVYQTTWNANTNTPTIPAASAANKGHYYKVATAGSTSVGGVNEWKVGDWLISNGTSWDKIDNTDAVASVAGLMGAITASALKTALAITVADVGGMIAYPTTDNVVTMLNGVMLDEDNMASNSAVHVPTQQSVKAYVDGRTRMFESAPAALVSNSAYSFAHGLGAMPREVILVLRCKVMEGGYAVGEEIEVKGWYWDTSTLRGGQTWANTTHVGAGFYNTYRCVGKSGGSGSAFNCTPANWDVIIRAWP